MITASSLERLAMCPTSSVLPQIRETTEAAINGTKNHSGIEVQLQAYRDSGVIPEGKLGEIVAGQTILCIEGAFIIDLEKEEVRFLGESIGRAYGQLKPHEIGCTLDLMMQDASGNITILDWKTRGRVTDAESNWQIKAQVLCGLGWRTCTELRAGIVYLDNWWQDMATFDAFDGASIYAQLRNTVTRLRTALPTDSVHLGPWCDYCPAQTYCPGRAAIVRAAMVDAETPGSFDNLTDEAAGFVWTKIKLAKDVIEKAEEVLKARAKRSPIPLPNGRRLAMVESERSSIDNSAAIAMLEAAGMTVPYKVTRFATVRELGKATKAKGELECK